MYAGSSILRRSSSIVLSGLDLFFLPGIAFYAFTASHNKYCPTAIFVTPPAFAPIITWFPFRSYTAVTFMQRLYFKDGLHFFAHAFLHE